MRVSPRPKPGRPWNAAPASQRSRARNSPGTSAAVMALLAKATVLHLHGCTRRGGPGPSAAGRQNDSMMLQAPEQLRLLLELSES